MKNKINISEAKSNLSRIINVLKKEHYIFGDRTKQTLIFEKSHINYDKQVTKKLLKQSLTFFAYNGILTHGYIQRELKVSYGLAIAILRAIESKGLVKNKNGEGIIKGNKSDIEKYLRQFS